MWSMVAGNNPFLTKPQFYSTLRLISLAQVSDCGWGTCRHTSAGPKLCASAG